MKNRWTTLDIVFAITIFVAICYWAMNVIQWGVK
jgi:hypothetical protein